MSPFCHFDGRGPPLACRQWDGKGSLVLFAVSLNLKRRHLSAGQKAALAVEIEPLLAAEAKVRQREHGWTAPGRKKKSLVATLPQVSDGPAPKARDEAVVGTSARYVQDAKKVQAAAPELLDKVRAGELTLPQAVRRGSPWGDEGCGTIATTFRRAR